MARISRKQLKENRFAEEVSQSVEYVAHHRKRVIVWALAVIGLIVAVTAFIGYQRRQTAQARYALQEAINLFHGELETPDEQIGVITFATNIEKHTRVTEAFEKVSQDFPNRFEGAAARYYLALDQIEQGNWDEGQQGLEAVVQGGDAEASSLARKALADLLSSQGKKDEARVHYEYLAENPSSLVPKVQAELGLAELLIESDPERARSLLEPLQIMPGAASIRATSMLMRIPSQPAQTTSPSSE